MIFFSLTEAPLTDPTTTPPNTPETDPKRTRNRPQTEPNGAEMDRNQALSGGTAGGVVGMGRGGGCKGKRISLPSARNKKEKNWAGKKWGTPRKFLGIGHKGNFLLEGVCLQFSGLALCPDLQSWRPSKKVPKQSAEKVPRKVPVLNGLPRKVPKKVLRAPSPLPSMYARSPEHFLRHFPRHPV